MCYSTAQSWPNAPSFGSWSFGLIIFHGLSQDGAGSRDNRHGLDIHLCVDAFAVVSGKCRPAKCDAMFGLGSHFTYHAADIQSGVPFIGLYETSSCRQKRCSSNEVYFLYILDLP